MEKVSVFNCAVSSHISNLHMWDEKECVCIRVYDTHTSAKGQLNYICNNRDNRK